MSNEKSKTGWSSNHQTVSIAVEASSEFMATKIAKGKIESRYTSQSFKYKINLVKIEKNDSTKSSLSFFERLRLQSELRNEIKNKK
jgi:hypothetical protein